MSVSLPPLSSDLDRISHSCLYPFCFFLRYHPNDRIIPELLISKFVFFNHFRSVRHHTVGLFFSLTDPLLLLFAPVPPSSFTIISTLDDPFSFGIAPQIPYTGETILFEPPKVHGTPTPPPYGHLSSSLSRDHYFRVYDAGVLRF